VTRTLYNTKVGPKAGGLLIDALQTIVFALGLSVVIYLFLAIPNQVDGLSMMPNLHNGEILITNKFIQIAGGPGKLFPGYDYQRGDIVVFQQPNRPDLVKRIVGLPGDRIKIEGGRVFINGKVLAEDYLPAGRRTDPGDFVTEGVEKRVPEGHYFLMGDNRGNSKDSRTSEVGFVRREYIKGSPFLRVLPVQTLGLLTRGESRLLDNDN
jgi:signal peptidase I